MALTDGQIVRADYIGDFNASDMLAQVYQFKLLSGGPLDEADMLDDLEEIFDTIWDIIKGLHSVLVAFRKVRSQLVPTGTLLGDLTFASPYLGTSADDVSAVTQTMPVSFKTVVPRVILRKSWGPPAENQINQTGGLTAAAVTALGTAAAALLANLVMTNGTWEYGYYSPKTTSWETPVTAVTTSRPGTMARRRVGRGS
jgi:hypothetical protein